MLPLGDPEAGSNIHRNLSSSPDDTVFEDRVLVPARSPLCAELRGREILDVGLEADPLPHPSGLAVLFVRQIPYELAARLASIEHLWAVICKQIARGVLVGIALGLLPVGGIGPRRVVLRIPLGHARPAIAWVPYVAVGALEGVPLRVLRNG